MASNRGLSNEEIFNELFPEEQHDEETMGGVDVQSDATETDTEYEMDSDEEEEIADYGHPLRYLSSGQRLSAIPEVDPNQVSLAPIEQPPSGTAQGRRIL